MTLTKNAVSRHETKNSSGTTEQWGEPSELLSGDYLSARIREPDLIKDSFTQAHCGSLDYFVITVTTGII